MKKADESFKFDIDAKRVRLSDDQLLTSVKAFAAKVDYRYFSLTEYDKWAEKGGHSATIIDRFGSWNKVLSLLGIEGGHERRYSAEELVNNLEKVWTQLGYPPGKRQLSKFGKKISETPYKHKWGSVHNACVALARFHEGKLSKDDLYSDATIANVRRTIPLKIRWEVLKRDNYTCKKCGRSPSLDHKVQLEVDHRNPVAKGGLNNIENLQTLCRECNQGKKDRK